MPKALIIGGKGFIGLHLANKLLEDGYWVDILDLSDDPKSDLELKKTCQSPKARFLENKNKDGTLPDYLDLDYTHIVHLAAILGVQNVLKNAFSVLDLNVALTSSALKIGKAQTKLRQFIFASTSEVYAGTLEAGKLVIPTPEDSQIVLPDLDKPRTSYMLSKLYGEALTKQSHLPYSIIRPHNIYGPMMGYRHVIPQLLQKAFASNGSLEVFSPTHTRSFCYISDAVKQICMLMSHENAIEKTINVGTEAAEITMYQLAEMIVKEVNSNLEIVKMPDTFGSPKRREPDMSLCAKLTNFRSEIDLLSGLQKTKAWYANDLSILP